MLISRMLSWKIPLNCVALHQHFTRPILNISILQPRFLYENLLCSSLNIGENNN